MSCSVSKVSWWIDHKQETTNTGTAHTGKKWPASPNDIQVQSQGRNPTKQIASLTTWPAATSQFLPTNSLKPEPRRNWYDTHHTRRWTQPISCATHSYVGCGMDTLFLNPRDAPNWSKTHQNSPSQKSFSFGLREPNRSLTSSTLES